MDLFLTVALIAAVPLGMYVEHRLGWGPPPDPTYEQKFGAFHEFLEDREEGDLTPRTDLDKLLRRQLP